MKKNVKALFLNSKTGKVEEIQFDGNYDSIYGILGEKVEHIHWDIISGDIIYYDFEQEDNYTKKDKGFMLANGHCYYGNGLIIGNKGENENEWEGTDVNITKEQVENEIKFGRLQSVLVIE